MQPKKGRDILLPLGKNNNQTVHLTLQLLPIATNKALGNNSRESAHWPRPPINYYMPSCAPKLPPNKEWH